MTSTFIVERYLPGASRRQLEAIVERLTDTPLVAPTRYRGSIIVPGDEACLCLFDAEHVDAVHEVNAQLGLPVSRIVAAAILPPALHAAITA